MRYSREFHELIVKIAYDVKRLQERLIYDPVILINIPKGAGGTTLDMFIAYVIYYDMSRIAKLITEGKITYQSAESMGLLVAMERLIGDPDSHLSDKLYEHLLLGFEKELYKSTIKSVVDTANADNPVTIRQDLIDWNKTLSGINPEERLALPSLLKSFSSDVFEEYASTLFRFANVLAKADGKISSREEEILRQIYNLLYRPVMMKVGGEKKAENSKAEPVAETESKQSSLEEILSELNSLIGLSDVKKELNTLINFLRVQKMREESGLKSSDLSYHIVFTGNPGTGKTTVARIIAKVYKALGILSGGQLVETDRADLIAEYVGQTAVKVDKVVDSAINGVLFIDEAYAIAGQGSNDYGKEAIATLLKRMEDDRDKLVVIAAGYTEEMQTFINTNPGLKSRFNRYIEFPDYSPAELFEIFQSMCNKLDYRISGAAAIKLQQIFEKAYASRDKTFGNARFVRNIFEKTLELHANRIVTISKLDRSILTSIEEADIPIEL